MLLILNSQHCYPKILFTAVCFWVFQNCQQASKKQENSFPAIGKSVSMIATHNRPALGDSLQCSIYMTRLNDSVLEYDISIIRNWRLEWLNTKGFVHFEKNKTQFAEGGLLGEPQFYPFSEYSNTKNDSTIRIIVGQHEAFVCFDFNKGKTAIPCGNTISFWYK